VELPDDNPPKSDGLGVYHGTVPKWAFGLIDYPDRQFGNGLVGSQTRTRSDGPELLLTLTMGAFCSIGNAGVKSGSANNNSETADNLPDST
jgi:hypothetical protein